MSLGTFFLCIRKLLFMRKTLISVLLSLSVISVADGLEDLTNLYMYSFQALGEEWEKQEREEQQRREMRQNNPELRNQEFMRQEQQRKARLKTEGYVDLGLPSGTLWKGYNEGGAYTLYKYSEAKKKFGKNLPSREQWSELMQKCEWRWASDGYVVQGPNGNSIFLNASGFRDKRGKEYGVGFRGYYWSSNTRTNHSKVTKTTNTFVDCLFFGAEDKSIQMEYDDASCPVRLVTR